MSMERKEKDPGGAFIRKCMPSPQVNNEFLSVYKHSDSMLLNSDCKIAEWPPGRNSNHVQYITKSTGQ